MEIKEMTIEQIEARKAELVNGLDAVTEKAELDTIEEEMRSLNNEIEERKATAAAAAEEARKVADGAGEVIIDEIAKETIMTEERNVMTADSKEYRNAFYTYLVNPTEEARTALANTISVSGTNSGAGLAIPTTLDEKIWDNVHTAHPILADINTIRTGITLKVTKHTAITAGKAAAKNDGDAITAAETNTFVEVNLIGKDFAKYVMLTYAEAKMSQGALEDYLAEEIAADLGEAMAKDVVTSISTDAQTATAQATAFATVATLVGAAEHAVKPVIYCNAANYYALFGAVDSVGQPIFRDGVAIGADVKIDSAVTTGYMCVDPKKFVYNVVEDVMVESYKDIKEHVIVVSGYARAQGCLRDAKAASKVSALIAG